MNRIIIAIQRLELASNQFCLFVLKRIKWIVIFFSCSSNHWHSNGNERIKLFTLRLIWCDESNRIETNQKNNDQFKPNEKNGFPDAIQLVAGKMKFMQIDLCFEMLFILRFIYLIEEKKIDHSTTNVSVSKAMPSERQFSSELRFSHLIAGVVVFRRTCPRNHMKNINDTTDTVVTCVTLENRLNLILCLH